MILQPKDFCELLGTQSPTPKMLEQINQSDFRYEVLVGEEKDKMILQILKKIESDTLRKSGEVEPWQNCWDENLQNFKKTGRLEELSPKYYLPSRICRFNGQYIKTTDPLFELNVFKVIRYYMIETYMKSANEIFEFGCGSGYNLPIIADVYPNKKIHGLDWANSSIEIVNLIKEKFNLNVEGHLFNIFEPNYELEIPEKSHLITFGLLEQIGKNYDKFIDFLFTKKPKLICHVEPICEFYDNENLLDYLAIKFHKHRNYLDGYYDKLQSLNGKKINILDARRVKFGNAFHEGWSIIIWEVL